MSIYSVKEIFYSLQGEGAQAGRPALFCRFSGCNLWSGREQDRAKSQCSFCDTDFVGTDGANGGKYRDAHALIGKLRQLWPASHRHPHIIFTGGEPLLQLDQSLVDACHAASFSIAVETNGSLPAPTGIDWLCVSPKGSTPIVLTKGDELKLVHPQPGLDPSQFENLNFEHFFLQPCDDAQQQSHIRSCVEYCLQHPQWRLSLQIHKLLGIE